MRPNDISHLTKDIALEDLKGEVARRESEERLLKQQKRLERAALIQRFLVDRALLELLAPEHDRTSCTDENATNSWGSRSDGGYRCLRCALLSGYWDEDFDLEVTVTKAV